MKIMEALATKNLMLVNGNRWLVLRETTFTVFEHHFHKVTDSQLYSGTDEESAVKILLEGLPQIPANEN
jgi:hypothetical protein